MIDILEINKKTSNDKIYLETLAKSVNCPLKNLQNIVGLDELKNILKSLTCENFNPKSKDYIADLHTHTNFSDGKATVEDILSEAQMRAEKSGKNFLIGINDHDTLNSAKELVKILAKNYSKYSNVKVVIAVEPCFKYENKNILKCPIPFDCLIYCINPFDSILNEFFNNYTNKNKNYAKIIFQKANNRWKINANWEDAEKYHCLIKTGGSSGFFKFIRHYIEDLLDKSQIFYTPVEIIELFKRFSLNQNFRVTLATPDIKDVKELIKKSQFGEIGIAHPALVELNPKYDRDFDFVSKTNFLKGVSYDLALSEFIKTCGLEFIELNYQYPENLIKCYPEIIHLKDVVDKTCDNLNIYKTGGTDSHGGNFGKILLGRY